MDYVTLNQIIRLKFQAIDIIPLFFLQERSKSEWVLIILVPILVFIILVFLVVCIVRIILKKRRGGAYDPAAREEVAMINYTVSSLNSLTTLFLLLCHSTWRQCFFIVMRRHAKLTPYRNLTTPTLN